MIDHFFGYVLIFNITAIYTAINLARYDVQLASGDNTF